MVAVTVPKGAAVAGTGSSFDLPENIQSLASNVEQVLAQQADGSPLPAWLRFDRKTLRFEATAVPDGAFPMQVSLIIGSQRVLVVISERTE